MKREKIRISCVILSLMLVLAMSVPVFAGTYKEIETAFVFDEAEYYEFLSNADEEMLEAEGLTSETAQILLNEYDKAIGERASLSEKELINLGYSQGDIAIIKSINVGSKLTESQLRAITATCTASISNCSMNGTYCIFHYVWNWNNCPVVTLKDEVAAKWIAFNSGGIAMDSDVYSSSCYAVYYSGSTAIHTGYATKDSSNESFYALGYKFNTLYYYEGEDPEQVYSAYAKTGVMSLTLKTAQNSSFDHVKVIAKYGHTTLVTSSIGFSVSNSNTLAFSFTPTIGISTTAIVRVKISYGGVVSPL